MLITPSFKKSLIVEQFQGNYLKLLVDYLYIGLVSSYTSTGLFIPTQPLDRALFTLGKPRGSRHASINVCLLTSFLLFTVKRENVPAD